MENPPVPTKLPVLPASEWAKRMIDVWPRGWTGDDANQVGGAFYALVLAMAQTYSFLSQQALNYAMDGTRLTTSINGAIDLFSQDFFGTQLPRNVGESDANYIQRIKLNLFPQPRVTRPGVSAAIETITGYTPRLGEPWSIGDTACWDGPVGYWDIDVAQMPGRWGDPSLRYIGFVDTAGINATATGQNPVYAMDDGMGMDTPTGYLWDPTSYWYSTGKVELAQYIQNVKAWGTKIYFKIVTPAQLLSTGPSPSVYPVVWYGDFEGS